jgi:CheY-like chemotaxis protein
MMRPGLSPSRVLLIHWDAALGREGLARLRDAGHRSRLLRPVPGGEDLRAVPKAPPDLVVIDLGRSPSLGSAVATWLRQQKGTRHVPIVFIMGERGRTARVRRALPDAVYTTWDRIAVDLPRAFARRPADPVVPGTMDIYAGRPLAGKLGIKPGSLVALLEAPAGFERLLAGLPPGVRLARHLRSKPRTILLFVKSRAGLVGKFPAAARALDTGGALWIVWPKQASGLRTDLTQQEVRDFGLGSGFVDYKICRVDATWSGLCFARRKRR